MLHPMKARGGAEDRRGSSAVLGDGGCRQDGKQGAPLPAVGAGGSPAGRPAAPELGSNRRMELLAARLLRYFTPACALARHQPPRACCEPSLRSARRSIRRSRRRSGYDASEGLYLTLDRGQARRVRPIPSCFGLRGRRSRCPPSLRRSASRHACHLERQWTHHTRPNQAVMRVTTSVRRPASRLVSFSVSYRV
jgi:hypothetical protein